MKRAFGNRLRVNPKSVLVSLGCANHTTPTCHMPHATHHTTQHATRHTPHTTRHTPHTTLHNTPHYAPPHPHCHQLIEVTHNLQGKLAKFATYVMQESEILKFRNYWVCSVVTDETQPQRPIVAVGAFGKWFFGDSLN
jgi:hypothetical protein